MKDLPSKIKIFESNIKDGIMSDNPKFYDKDCSTEDIRKKFLETRQAFGQKNNLDGRKFYRPIQKSTFNNLDYPDGKYQVLNKLTLTAKDGWYEKTEGDILILEDNTDKLVVCHQMADCPILIIEDRKLGVTALSHCGVTYIDRLLPIDTVKALEKEFHSNPENLYAYIGSCAKKESYIYQDYPNWATNSSVWENCIIKEEDGYHIDLEKAIIKQLRNLGISHIEVSPIDTIEDPNYYSHAAIYHGKKQIQGQNLVGFYYK